ncbi:ThiJ/PfpI family protein [Wilcoxina mikolae CBS 423.85]|nr:ThiJ/PfpI family protein [Wilcoxina mikolae CBS 423.85]
MSSQSKYVLIILSSYSTITVEKSDGTKVEKETGFFLKELAQPLLHLLEYGYSPVFASPSGQKPNMDPLSDNAIWFLSFAEKEKEKQLLDKMSVEKNFSSPKRFADISDEELSQYRGVFVPGGHAPMGDLGSDPDLGRILSHFHNEGKPTAVICHGPIALLSMQKQGEKFPYDGYKVTCYANKEEVSNELLWGGKIRRVEDALREAGCVVETAALPLLPKLVVDRELVSGENPASADQLGVKFVEMLEGKV